MAISIEERELRGTAILVISGRLTSTESRGHLKNAVRALVERGRKQIVLDLEAVPFLDTAGLGELVSSYVGVKRLGGALKLANVNRRVMMGIEAVRLTQVLQFTDLPRQAPTRAAHTR